MKLRSFSPLVAAGFAVAMLLSHALTIHAQVDEARTTNWNNASRLYELIVSAVEAKKPDEVVKLTKELRDNLDYVHNKLGRVGERLHAKDRNWDWSSKKDHTLHTVSRTRVAAGSLELATQQRPESADSEFRAFKSEWKELVESMNDLWRLYLAHARELNDISKAFREDCRECS
jgi:hypothetical protein